MRSETSDDGSADAQEGLALAFGDLENQLRLLLALESSRPLRLVALAGRPHARGPDAHDGRRRPAWRVISGPNLHWPISLRMARASFARAWGLGGDEAEVWFAEIGAHACTVQPCRSAKEFMKRSKPQLRRPTMFDQTTNAVNAPTQFVAAGETIYAYRRFGNPDGLPLLCLQHFTGTLDNWDPAVVDALAGGRELILFENAGVGRSTGSVPDTIAGMAEHALAFLDALGLGEVDVLGYSLGGMVAQQMVQDRPAIFRRMILVGTAPRGGEDIMHLDKPSLALHFADPTLEGYEILQKIFFTPSEESQAAGAEFIDRLMQRQVDREPQSGGNVVQAQMAAFREWEVPEGERFADLLGIWTPTLVVNGVADELIAVRNSYWLVENLPNAVLLVFPDAGHGSLFQYHAAFTRQVAAFLASDSENAAI